MSYRSPIDLIADVRRSRGSDPGPPNLGYVENRSLESPDGTLGAVTPDLIPDPPPWTPPQLPDDPPPLPPQPQPQRVAMAPGDHVFLSDLSGRLGDYPVTITDAEAGKIRAILVKAIRRDLRSYGGSRRKKKA